jgi:hypothetical protein
MNWKRWNRLKQPWSDVQRIWIDGWSIDLKSGNGDLLYNTVRAIIERKEFDMWDSRWAIPHLIISEIFLTLDTGKRWPNHMSEYITANKHKQTDPTKDPWIMAYCCAVHLNRYDLIEKYPPPTKPVKTVSKKWRKWSYFNWYEFAWYDALRGYDNAYRLFRLLPFHIFLPKHTYVLIGFMQKAYEQSKKK